MQKSKGANILGRRVYVGFSAATGVLSTHHYVLGWSFSLDGPAPPLNFSKLPALPLLGLKPQSKVLDVALPLTTTLLVATALTAIVDGVFWYTKHVHYTSVWI
jgi:hypothetical protein